MCRVKMIFGLLVVCFVMNVCCCVANTSAAKCKDIVNAYNPSLYYACQGTGANGAMWVSSSANTGSTEAIVNYDGVSSSIVVYMHGVVIDNDGDKKDQQPATCVKVFATDASHPKLSTDKAQENGGTLTCTGAAAYNSYPSPLNISSLPGGNYGKFLQRELARRGTRGNDGQLRYNNSDNIISTAGLPSVFG